MRYFREPTYEVSFYFRRVLVPTDGSATSMRALEVALDFSKRYGSIVTVLIVDDSYIKVEEVRERVSKRVEDAGVKASIKVVKLSREYESVASKIIEEAYRGDYDLIVMSARGRTALEDIVIGSTTLAVAVNAPLSVMIIR